MATKNPALLKKQASKGVFTNKATGQKTDKFGAPSTKSGASSLPTLSGTAQPSTPPKVKPKPSVKPTKDLPLEQQPMPNPTPSVKPSPNLTPSNIKETEPNRPLPEEYATQQEYADALNKYLGRPTQTDTAATPGATTGQDGATQQVDANGVPIPTQPAAIQAEIDSIQNQENLDIDELKTLQQSSLDAETDYKGTMEQLANDRYAAEQGNLDRMETLQEQILRQRKESINAISAQERADAKAAYEKNEADLEVQRKRTEKAYQDQIVEQAVSNTKRTLQMENFIAATGGFGSLTKNKQMMELTLSNDRLLNTVKFEKDMADREVTNEMVAETNTYQNNLMEIENKKMEETNKAYSEYLSYVTDIQNDRDLSEQEKFETIQTAAADYKKNVAKINQDSFTARYEVAQTAAEKITNLKLRVVDPEVSKIFGYATDAAGNAILGEDGQKITLPEDPANATQYEFVKPTYDAYGRLQSPGGYFDPSTGQFTMDTALGVPSEVRGSGGYGYQTQQQKDALADLFGVGTYGGQCAAWGETITDTGPVGDTWTEKYSHIDNFGEPKQGDALLIPAGVTDKGGYGHYAVVLAYDPDTGIIQAVDANADGKSGTISLETYNINDLRKKYGEKGFGFKSGTLKQPYKDAVDGIMGAYSNGYGTPSSGGVNPADIYAEADMLKLTGDAAALYIQARLNGQDQNSAITTAMTTTAGGNVKLSATQQEKITVGKDVLSLIDKVMQYNADGSLEGIGGAFQGSIASAIDNVFGSSSPEARDVRQLIGNIKATIAKQRGGTAFSAQEMAMLEQYAPTIDENAAVVLSKLQNLQEYLQTDMANTISTAQGSYESTPFSTPSATTTHTQQDVQSLAADKGVNIDIQAAVDSGYSLDEIYDYINQQ